MLNESNVPADTPFRSENNHGSLYSFNTFEQTYANCTKDTTFDENLAHINIFERSVTSQTYSTELSPPIPSLISAVATYVLLA